MDWNYCGHRIFSLSSEFVEKECSQEADNNSQMTKGTFSLLYQIDDTLVVRPSSATYYKKDKAYPLLYSKQIKRNHISVLSSVSANTIKQNRIFCGAQRRRQVSNLSFSFLCIFMVCFIKARTIWWYIVRNHKNIVNKYLQWDTPTMEILSNKLDDDENPYAANNP